MQHIVAGFAYVSNRGSVLRYNFEVGRVCERTEGNMWSECETNVHIVWSSEVAGPSEDGR